MMEWWLFLFEWIDGRFIVCGRSIFVNKNWFYLVMILSVLLLVW